MQRSKRILSESLERQSREGKHVKGLKKFSILAITPVLDLSYYEIYLAVPEMG